VGTVRFGRPIRIGDLVEVETRLACGTTSMFISVRGARWGRLSNIRKSRLAWWCLSLSTAKEDAVQSWVQKRQNVR
jgi:acyl-CoA hydrolase